MAIEGLPILNLKELKQDKGSPFHNTNSEAKEIQNLIKEESEVLKPIIRMTASRNDQLYGHMPSPS